MVVCVICDENRPFLCIGSCNHAICSICAVRMRFKNKDLKCTLCKQVNEMMVVCEDKSADNESNKANGKSSSSSSSSSFVRYEDFDLFGDSAAGGITLEEAKILFLDCKAHYETIKDLISFHCPHTSCANKVHRFNSIDALNQHLQCKHQRVLCKLCVTHRALFISEQTLFTSKELQKHIQLTDISPSSSSSSSSSSRHPLCQFCKENFYDAADLFQHMRQQHFSCRFCPIEFQHRYYRNPSSLNAHIASSHLTCPFQNCPEAHRAFDTQEDYATHMRLSHHSSSAGGGRRGRGGHQPVHLITEAHHHHHHQSSSSGAHPSEGLQYLDLYAASPDPNIPSNERQSGYRPDGRASSSSASTSATYIQPVSNRVPLIPPNMRIAGRVRNGNFARDASDALLERAYSTAAEQSIGSNGNGRGKPASQLRRRTDDFPALASGDHKKIVEEKKTPSIHEEHPLSLVTKERRLKALEAYKLKKEAEEAAKKKEQEEEERRRLRNESMARALGLHTWDGRDSSLLSPQLKEASLDVPVYTIELVTWARNNPGEVLRIEQRLDGFLRSKTAPSLAFKPMRAEYRALLHDIAKYYGLNSHEYDPEPERYVNVVKSADSHAPSILLSSAAKDSAFVLSPHVQDFQRPSFYLGMLYPAAGMTLALLMQKLTLHIFDQRLSPFFSSPDLSSSGACIKKISMQGASTIVVDFSSFEAALETYLSLIEVKAYTGRPAAAVSGALATNTSALMNLRFLDLFEIEPGFRLDGYMPIQSGALSIGAVEDAWGDNDTEEAGQPVAHDSGEHSSAVLLDNRNVSQVSSANEHYLDWQFRVGGNVSVAYAVESNEELKEDDGDWETVTVQHAFASTREVECAYGESMAEDESRRPSRNVENNGIDGVVGFIANSGIVVPEIIHSEYRPLNLLPRTLPPPLPPLPAPKTLKKNKVEDTKLQERDFPNRGAPQEERKLSNQFDSFVIDSDSDSDQEEKLNEDVLNASNAQVESQNNGVSWTCMRCTFANDYISGYGICMMCETPRS